MCLQSDGSDRKIISQQIDHKRISRRWMPDYVLSWSIFFYGRLFSGGCLFRKHRMLNVIRTKPWHHWCTPSTPLVYTLNTIGVYPRNTDNKESVCSVNVPINYLLVQHPFCLWAAFGLCCGHCAGIGTGIYRKSRSPSGLRLSISFQLWQENFIQVLLYVCRGQTSDWLPCSCGWYWSSPTCPASSAR